MKCAASLRLLAMATFRDMVKEVRRGPMQNLTCSSSGSESEPDSDSHPDAYPDSGLHDMLGIWPRVWEVDELVSNECSEGLGAKDRVWLQ